MFKFLSVSRFKSEAIRFLRFENAFNSPKTVRVINDCFVSTVVSNKKERFIIIRILVSNESSLKKFSSVKNIS